MRVIFWGTRGSLPTPLSAVEVRAKVRTALMLARERHFAGEADVDAFIDDLPFSVAGTFGGNSPCVQIDGGGAEYVLCDAGSGLRVFGNSALAKHGPKAPQTYHLCMSHTHWDHIMGFPFFTPAYIPGNRVRIYGVHDDLEATFRRQHGAPSFPLTFDMLGATIEFVQLTAGETYEIGGLAVTATLQQHGGDSYGYRFTQGAKTVVYATDSEHKFGSREDAEPFVGLFRDADVVVFDSMYSLGEAVSMKEDWGHSSNIVGIELAQEANVKHLVLFHHEPVYDDAMIERVLHESRRYAEIVEDRTLEISSAYDGMVIEI
jgi:phosphoribosyl 1,2-cyclic phosphodiesterase